MATASDSASIADTVRDLKFKLDSNYNRLLVSGPARYKQVVQMLFLMVPGMDEFNPEKGLNISAKLFETRENYSRDTEYETEITNQFSTYTDLVATGVVAMTIDDAYCVFMNINTPSGTYQTLISDKSNELQVLITDKLESVLAQ